MSYYYEGISSDCRPQEAIKTCLALDSASAKSCSHAVTLGVDALYVLANQLNLIQSPGNLVDTLINELEFDTEQSYLITDSIPIAMNKTIVPYLLRTGGVQEAQYIQSSGLAVPPSKAPETQAQHDKMKLSETDEASKQTSKAFSKACNEVCSIQALWLEMQTARTGAFSCMRTDVSMQEWSSSLWGHNFTWNSTASLPSKVCIQTPTQAQTRTRMQARRSA